MAVVDGEMSVQESQFGEEYVGCWGILLLVID